MMRRIHTEHISPGQTPADFAPAVVKVLAGPDASYITGQVLGIDGGQEVALSAPYPTGFERRAR